MKEFKSSKDPDLKVLLAIGGQDYAIRRANDMIAKNESRQKFVISTTKLLRTHEFDGIDLNFEPSEALGPPSTPNPQLIEDKKRLSILCKVRLLHSFEKISMFILLINRIFKKNMQKKRVEQDDHVYYLQLLYLE